MSLNKSALRTDIYLLLTEMRNYTETSDEEFAESLANIIDYIKSATITVPAGIAVEITGDPTTQSGETTKTAIATIS